MVLAVAYFPNLWPCQCCLQKPWNVSWGNRLSRLWERGTWNWYFQPSQCCGHPCPTLVWGAMHTIYILLMVIPIPSPELALEKAWKSKMEWRKEMGIIGSGEDERVFFHHLMSSRVPCGGVGMKGESLKIGIMAMRFVRYVQLAEKISEACNNLPCSFCTSARVCICFDSDLVVALTYLTYLTSIKVTVWSDRFHLRPMKVRIDVKGMSFDSS